MLILVRQLGFGQSCARGRRVIGRTESVRDKALHQQRSLGDLTCFDHLPEQLQLADLECTICGGQPFFNELKPSAAGTYPWYGRRHPQHPSPP